MLVSLILLILNRENEDSKIFFSLFFFPFPDTSFSKNSLNLKKIKIDNLMSIKKIQYCTANHLLNLHCCL